MGVEDIIQSTPEYRSINEAQRANQQPSPQQPTPSQDQGSMQTTLNVAPITQMEKTDLMFWLLVADTVLLAIIALKV